MLSAKIPKNCILFVAKVLVGDVLVKWLGLVMRKCEVVVVICEGSFWFLIRLVVHVARLVLDLGYSRLLAVCCKLALNVQ